LRLVATNLDLTVSRRVRATVSSAGRTTAPARLLADYVALLDRGKQVSLTLTSSGHKLHLACDRYEANIATLPQTTFRSRQLWTARYRHDEWLDRWLAALLPRSLVGLCEVPLVIVVVAH